MDRDFISGTQIKSTTGIGKTTRCMEKENFTGQMGNITKVTMKKMKDMEKGL